MLSIIIAATITETIILAGDTNIKVNEPSRPQKRYQEILENFNLVQHINLPTRKGSRIIDHIIANIPNKILYSNVLPWPSTSDYEPSYITAKILTNKYQARYKFIKNMKNFDLQKFNDDFKQLSFSVVHSFDNADDQLDTLNKIILECIDFTHL